MRRSQLALARRALDARLAEVPVTALAPPAAGWLRAIRDALGMTTRQMAKRMGVSAMTVSNIEQSERAGTVQLDTLRRAADALECDVVYAIVPRTDLNETVHSRARKRALDEIGRVNRTMQLEQQGLNDEQLRQRVEEFAAKLVDQGSIWDGPDP